MLVRLAIDFENPARRWWENGGRDLWESVSEGFEQNDIVVDESIAASWLAQAEKIEGWNDGPEYAPHPVLTKPVDDDEDVPA